MQRSHVKLLERGLIAIPIMLGIAVLVFAFMRFLPGDPVDIMIGESGGVTQAEMDQLREQFNLDKPLLVQLGLYLGRLVRGDLGYSIFRSRPVAEVITETIPATVELALFSMLFALVVALPIGVISAVRQNSLLDRVSMAGAFLGISMPAFWLGIIGIIIFSVRLGWLPTSGRISYGFEPPEVTGFLVVDSILAGDFAALWDSLKHLILPSIVMGASVAAVVARVIRSSMLEVLRTDYILLARAKGLSEFEVIVRHGLRNALIPTVTMVGLQIGTLLGGNMIVETVFGWPGLGRLVVDAIFARDYPLVQGSVIVYALTFVVVNLITDLLYTYLNPRITL